MKFFQAAAVIAGMALLPSSLLIPLPAIADDETIGSLKKTS